MTTHPTELIGRLGEALRTSSGKRAAIGKQRGRQRSGSLRGLGLWWTFAAALVLGVAIIIAIAQNSRSVRVHYIVWDSSVSLIVVVLATALAAILLDQAGGLIWRRRRRARIARHHELQQLRAERRTADETPATTAPVCDVSPESAIPVAADSLS
jgi:uncharacterized integral membrane protein